jgi:hypothetical protein
MGANEAGIRILGAPLRPVAITIGEPGTVAFNN